MAYPIAFYPGVATIDTAQTIDVQAASEKSDADIKLKATSFSWRRILLTNTFT